MIFQVLDLAADVLRRVPDLIDYETTAKILSDDPSPLNVVLLQEVSRTLLYSWQELNSLRLGQKTSALAIVLYMLKQFQFNLQFANHFLVRPRNVAVGPPALPLLKKSLMLWIRSASLCYYQIVNAESGPWPPFLGILATYLPRTQLYQ